AVGASGGVGIGASGAGASGVNRIATHVSAYIEGDGATGISADSLSLAAHDASSITSTVVGASLAIGGGVTGGGGLSPRVGLAQNEISNEVSAYLRSATRVTSRVGDIHLEAHSLGGSFGSQYTSTSGSVALETGDTVKVAAGHKSGGDVGAVYRFLGQDYNYT